MKQAISRVLRSTLPAASILLFLGGLAGCIQAVQLITSNQYIEQKMFRLSLEVLLNIVNTWLLVSLAFCIIVLLCTCIVFFTKQRRESKLIKIIASIIVCLCLGYVGKFFNHFVLEQQTLTFQWSTTLLIAVVMGAAILGILCIWRDGCSRLSSLHIVSMILPGIICCSVVGILNSIFIFGDTENVQQKPNIILIVIDCLRARDLGCYGSPEELSPAIDQLAQQGVIFRKAYANAIWTKPSVASLFTSLPPTAHLAVNREDALPDRRLTIAEILKNNGYRTSLFNGGNDNCHTAFNFQQGFDYSMFEPKRDAALLTSAFLNFMAQSGQQPFFSYIHYMDAHLPYKPNEFSQKLLADKKFSLNPEDNPDPDNPLLSCKPLRMLSAANRLTTQDKLYLKKYYDSQIRYIDKHIQDIMSFLQNTNTLDKTIVILTADHGEEFWEHNNFEHGHSAYEEILHVPLIITGGMLEHKVLAEPVQLIDVMPTLLDLAQIAQPDVLLHGSSLKRSIMNDEAIPSVTIKGSGTLYGDEKFYVIKDYKKIIYNSGTTKNKLTIIGPTAPKGYEYYNLLDDHNEQHPLPKDKAEEFNELSQEIHQFIKNALLSTAVKEKVQLSKDITANLRSLGYVE